MLLTATDATELFRAPPHDFVDVGDGAIAVRTVGSGPHVLFVHGWPVSGATFRRLLPDLAPYVTCHVIDLLGAGSSRFDAGTQLSLDRHIEGVRSVLDHLGIDEVAVVGHDSGGMIVRHALAGDDRLRAMGLVDTEPSTGVGRRFRMFVAARHLPGFGRGLGWVAGHPRVRRLRHVLGDAFADPSLLDGEFDEFFLQPLHRDPVRRDAATTLLRSFRFELVDELEALHARIDVPVQLVWGEHDVFFPVQNAAAMVPSFAAADLDVISGAGLFSHEERPAEVAAALLPVLIG